MNPAKLSAPGGAGAALRNRASDLWRAAAPRTQALLVAGTLLLVALAVIGIRMVQDARDTSFADIRDRGVWRVGMDPSFPPFESLDPATGGPAGFDVDLARAIAGRWGVRVELVGVGFDELIDAAAAGRVDSALSALPAVPWRDEEVAASIPYFEAGLLLAAPAGSPIRSASELAGQRVAVEWGSEGEAFARSLGRDGGPAPLVARYESASAALAAVAAGDAGSAAVDAVSLALFNQSRGGLIVAGPALRSDPYVILVAHDAAALKRELNAAIAALRADGTLDRLRATWLSPELPDVR